MDKHSGVSAWLGALVAIYGAITQPSVVAAMPGKAGHVLSAAAVLSPVISAAVGSLGAIVAAVSMPRGAPKSE